VTLVTCVPSARLPSLAPCNIETIDSELQLVAALRRAARERGGPLPSDRRGGCAVG
jgi:hypothetical protein